MEKKEVLFFMLAIISFIIASIFIYTFSINPLNFGSVLFVLLGIIFWFTYISFMVNRKNFKKYFRYILLSHIILIILFYTSLIIITILIKFIK